MIINKTIEGIVLSLNLRLLQRTQHHGHWLANNLPNNKLHCQWCTTGVFVDDQQLIAPRLSHRVNVTLPAFFPEKLNAFILTEAPQVNGEGSVVLDEMPAGDEQILRRDSPMISPFGAEFGLPTITGGRHSSGQPSSGLPPAEPLPPDQ